jgi:hypothetical protein
MTYGDDKKELERILARSADLRERFFFSLACTFVVFLAAILSERAGYQWLMVGLFISTIGGVVYSLSIAAREKRLKLRYYNLHYRVQAEHEKAEQRGFIGRDRKW